MKKISMTNQIMLATILGVAAGLLIGPSIAPIKILGDIFLRLIQMSVVALIMGAVIEALGSLDAKELGKIGIKTFSWFMITTILAAALGILLGFLIQPGKNVALIASHDKVIEKATNPSIGEMIIDFFPKNIFAAMANANMIQVIVFALLFGVAISLIRKNVDVTNFMDNLKIFNQIILKLVTMIMKIAPIGIFALMAWVTGTVGLSVMIPLVKFLLAFAIGTVVFTIIWFSFVAIYVRTSFINLLKKFSRIMILAFTSTSSAITLPVEMEDAENKLGVSKRMSQLVLPLGMALNSNGLGMFLSLASITLAQFYHMPLTIADTIQMVVLATLACLGTVVVPGGGLVALAIIIPALGLPPESIALLAGIDWFSGMFRTVLNVTGDTTVAMLVAKDEKELDMAILNK